MKKFFVSSIFLITVLLLSSKVFAHCEVPCGIYDDKARIASIHEHITTIAKAMTKIEELSKEGDKNYNQIIRWVTNKEKHAEEIQDIVNQYFLTQRIKGKDVSDEAAYAKYISEVTLLHQMLVSAMKAKQTTDSKHTDNLHKLVEEFSGIYFADHHKGSMKGDMKKGS